MDPDPPIIDPYIWWYFERVKLSLVATFCDVGGLFSHHSCLHMFTCCQRWLDEFRFTYLMSSLASETTSLRTCYMCLRSQGGVAWVEHRRTFLKRTFVASLSDPVVDRENKKETRSSLDGVSTFFSVLRMRIGTGSQCIWGVWFDWCLMHEMTSLLV